MAKTIKEIIIMLLVCLIGILLFAVVFYEYIPTRKVVAEVTTYKASNTVEELLADNIDQNSNNVILTFEEGEYEVTSSDLNNYEATNIYVPGKANPFAPVSEDVDGNATIDPTDKNNNTSSNTTNNDSNETYITDKGTK